MYVDFSKALDNEPHERLSPRRINGKTFDWIKKIYKEGKRLSQVDINIV